MHNNAAGGWGTPIRDGNKELYWYNSVINKYTVGDFDYNGAWTIPVFASDVEGLGQGNLGYVDVPSTYAYDSAYQLKVTAYMCQTVVDGVDEGNHYAVFKACFPGVIDNGE